MTRDRETTISRLLAMSDDEMVGSLVELGPSIAYPAIANDFADRVVARITAPGAATPGRVAADLVERLRSALAPMVGALGRSPFRRALVLAIVALLALAIAAAAIGLGVPGIQIIFGPASSAGASPTAAGTSQSPGGSPSFTSRPTPTPTSPFTGGRSVTLPEAQAGAGFALFVPADPALGQPQRTFLDGDPPFARVTLSYGEGGLLTEFLGEVDTDAFQKVLQPGTTIEALTIGGKPAYWISGQPHEFHYRLPRGFDRWESIEVVGNVLLWQRGDVTLRLESPLDRADAVRIAESNP